MVVGDIVNGLNLAAGFDFQPAATVSCCITSAQSWSSNVMFTNGVDQVYVADSTSGWGNINTKIMINNTNYIRLLAGNASFSGIQIQ